MKKIEYKIYKNGVYLDVSIDYNKNNLTIAKKEAHNGQYTIVEKEE